MLISPGAPRADPIGPSTLTLTANPKFPHPNPRCQVAASMVRATQGAVLSRARREAHFHSAAQTARRKRYEEVLLVQPDLAAGE